MVKQVTRTPVTIQKCWYEEVTRTEAGTSETVHHNQASVTQLAQQTVVAGAAVALPTTTVLPTATVVPTTVLPTQVQLSNEVVVGSGGWSTYDYYRTGGYRHVRHAPTSFVTPVVATTQLASEVVGYDGLLPATGYWVSSP